MRYRETEIQRDRKTVRQIDIETGRQRDRKIQREMRYRETKSQRDRKKRQKKYNN
jgi:hypothetical protein